MRRKRVRIIWMVLSVLLVLALPAGALAEDVGLMRYENIKKVGVSLSLEGNKAICTGSLTPQTGKSGSLTVTLYKQNGTAWVKVTSWSASGAAGKAVRIEETKIVSRGTYKLIAGGNVDGEVFTKESSTVTY